MPEPGPAGPRAQHTQTAGPAVRDAVTGEGQRKGAHFPPAMRKAGISNAQKTRKRT